MNYRKLYGQIEAITGPPESCKSADAHAALTHLKALVDLPPALSGRKTVAMYYLGIVEMKLRDAQAMIAHRSLEFLEARKLVRPHIEQLVGSLPQTAEGQQFEPVICRLCG